jgi:hypothetical protein
VRWPSVWELVEWSVLIGEQSVRRCELLLLEASS